MMRCSLILALAFLLRLPLAAQYTVPLRAEETAPVIALPDIHGHIRTLASTMGHVTLVYFWTPGCSYCVKENRDLAYCYRKFHKQGFEMYAVCLDQSMTAWRSDISRSELRYTQVIDTTGAAGHTAMAYRVTSLPFNYLIDQYGHILEVNIPSGDLYSILDIIYE
jgi:peroxiredoxin